VRRSAIAKTAFGAANGLALEPSVSGGEKRTGMRVETVASRNARERIRAME
jgi:hypothetical protein